jgi:hypothetical protein
MATYPLLERPLPDGVVTLAEYAEGIHRSEGYVRTWRSRPGFPEPLGELPGRGRYRGGLAYRESALIAFREGQPDLWGQTTTAPIATGRDPDERVTLGQFSDQIAGYKTRKTVTQYQGDEGFPAHGKDGLYRLGDLVEFFNNGRRGKRGPTKAASA